MNLQYSRNKGDIYAKDQFYCTYAKGLTRWMLNDLYKIVREGNHG